MRAYQLMANELKIGHVTVPLINMGLQLVISLGGGVYDPQHSAYSLDLPNWGGFSAGCCLFDVYEEVLSPPRRVFGILEGIKDSNRTDI